MSLTKNVKLMKHQWSKLSVVFGWYKNTEIARACYPEYWLATTNTLINKLSDLGTNPSKYISGKFDCYNSFTLLVKAVERYIENSDMEVFLSLSDDEQFSYANAHYRYIEKEMQVVLKKLKESQ